MHIHRNYYNNLLVRLSNTRQKAYYYILHHATFSLDKLAQKVLDNDIYGTLSLNCEFHEILDNALRTKQLREFIVFILEAKDTSPMFINLAGYLDIFVERMYEAAQAFKNVDRIL